MSNNSAETIAVIESQAILDTASIEEEGGIDPEAVVNNATILSDPDIDADVVEYLTADWTLEFKEAVFGRLSEETRNRLEAMLAVVRRNGGG